jgi:hypothetical protein
MQDGFLLCITRHALFDSCRRLKEENLADDQTMVIVRQADGIGADVAGRVSDVLSYHGHQAAARSKR